jgi:hypothetical protein
LPRSQGACCACALAVRLVPQDRSRRSRKSRWAFRMRGLGVPGSNPSQTPVSGLSRNGRPLRRGNLREGPMRGRGRHMSQNEGGGSRRAHLAVQPRLRLRSGLARRHPTAATPRLGL